MLLTDISVRALKPTDRQRTYFDDNTGGFGIRVSPGGTKTFVLMHGQRRQLTKLGRLGIVTLAEARTAAKRILAQKTLGQHQPKTKKFGEAYDLFKTEHIAKKKARTQYDYQRVFDLYFLKKLGSDRLQDVAYRDRDRHHGQAGGPALRAGSCPGRGSHIPAVVRPAAAPLYPPLTS